MKTLLKSLILFSLSISCTNHKSVERKITKINFSSSPCLGECPVMRFEIDSNRNFKFSGERFTPMLGRYIGKMDDSKYTSLVNCLDSLKFDKGIKRPLCDDCQTFKLLLQYNTSEIDTNNLDTDIGNEIAEKLLVLYKEIDLKAIAQPSK